jgi:formaldehyde-activating enzyme involved in methanogenesis
MSARGFIGKGDVYMNPIVAGVKQGWVGPFEATKFEIKPAVDVKDQVSKGKATYGQIIETVSIPKPATFTVAFAEVNKNTMATALMGTTQAVTQAAGDVADEVLIGKLDVWVPLAFVAVSSVIVNNSADSVVYVDGTDYIVNHDLGWVKILSGGAIADAASLKIDYHHAAVAGSDINGLTDADVRAAFKFDGQNQVDGLPAQVDVYEGVIASDAAFDFLADNFNSISLPGRMKTPVGFVSPFKVRLLTTASVG